MIQWNHYQKEPDIKIVNKDLDGMKKIRNHVDSNIQEIIKKMNKNHYGEKTNTATYMAGYKDALIDTYGYITDVEVDQDK